MTISFSNAVITDRLTALTRALDAAATGGKLLLYGGTQPLAGATTAEALLCEMVFPKPSAGTVANKILSINNPAPGMALANGTVTWARLVDGDGVWIADCDAGEQDSSAVVRIQNESAEIYAGGMVSVLVAQLKEV